MNFYTDTHAHIHIPPLSGTIKDLLERAHQANVKRFITIGVDLENSRAAKNTAEKYNEIYAAVGVHPHDASAFSYKQLAEFETLLGSHKVVAVGEVGLDYYRNHSPREKQLETFAMMADMALSVDLPLIIHSREAANDTVKVLVDIFSDRDHRMLFHCFNGDRALLDWGSKRENCMFSFAGNVTYPKATPLHEALAELPLHRIFIETDCPYLAPVPYRGKDNEPSYLAATAKYVAQAKKVNESMLAEQLEQNFIRIFGKLNHN